uniref:Reverse transcriptase domain-containing protein n=1 Tax=Phytophthora ramorum TaxID=164328 RepID=H3GPC8_PHYRM
MSVGSPNTSATHVARADCPHLSEPEWEALQRLSTVIGKAAVATMLRTLSSTEQHGVALGFIVKEQRETTARASVSPSATPRVESLKLHVSSYVGREYLVSNIVTNPIDEATKVVMFMKDLRDGPVKIYLFREYPSILEAAISLAMQEEFSLRQAKLHVHAPQLMPRPVVRPSGGPKPMDLSSATAAGSQQRREPTNGPAGAGRPAGDAIERVDIGHAAMKIAAPSESQSHCKKQDDKPNLVILKRLENPPTLASELMSLPVTSWKRFARDLHDGRIEQTCILADVERVTREAEELNQLISEGADALSAKSKKERFDEQGWDSLKASPFYKVLREYKHVLPDDIPAELPQDKGVQHEIDLVPGTKYCVTRQWPLPREQVKAIDNFFESRRKAGQMRESRSPHSAPTFCVKKPQGGWRIVHAYNKLSDATVPAQTPIPRKDVIIDSMTSSTIFSTLDLRDGFYQILMRESDIPLTAVSTPSGMLWEWLVMPQGLKNAPATFNRCVTHLLRSELRQFLGLATYLCKYVSNYAGKIRPLSQLLKKEAAWEWTADCQQAFEAVKQGLTEAPILAVADQDRPFHVVVIVWFTTNRVS